MNKIIQYVGRTFEYFLHDQTKKVAKCKEVRFNKDLGQLLFIGVSPCGSEVKVFKDKIHKFV